MNSRRFMPDPSRAADILMPKGDNGRSHLMAESQRARKRHLDTRITGKIRYRGYAAHTAAVPAQARYRHHRYYNFSELRPRYESCNCYFGYVGDGRGECTPVTSCSSEGGRCKASCPSQIGSEWYRSSP
jgi:hypothetical protein